jgi:hypothetical protein
MMRRGLILEKIAPESKEREAVISRFLPHATAEFSSRGVLPCILECIDFIAIKISCLFRQPK